MTSLKFALRTLFKTPFVTVVAIVSLALGIGANAAIFSLFDQMLVAPLPVPQPQRLVNLKAPPPKPGGQSCNQAGDCDSVFSYAMFRDLEKTQTVFTGIAAHVAFGANVAARGETSNEDGLLVSGSYFSVLELQPAAGRLITSDDDRTIGESHVVVLAYAFWQRRFGEDPSIVGQQIVVNGQSMTVVGVAPRGFDGTTIGFKPTVYVPITMRGFMQPGFVRADANGFENRRGYWAYLFARLKPGVTIDRARAALEPTYRAILNDVEAPLQKGMSPQTMARFKAKPLVMEPGAHGQSSVTRDAKGPLVLLLGVTVFVLLIACANIANLLLARSAAREGEMAVRLSIGASRWQLVRQLLLESMLLAIFGGLAGLLVARWTNDLILMLLPKEASDMMRVGLNRTVLAFTAAVTIGTGLLFGLFPALHSTRPDLASALKGQAGQPSGARTANRLRAILATTQIALAMALLISAGLFTKSLLNVNRADLGLNAENVVMFRIAPELNGYEPARSRELFERLEDEIARQPNVTSVTASTVPLLSGSNWGNSVGVEGFKAGPDTDTDANFNLVAPGYFHTLGIPMLAGRDFTRADALATPKVAIVNEAFLKKFNLGHDAVGRRISDQGWNGKQDIEIVGVVQNSKYSEVKRAVPPVFVRPYRQDERVGRMTFYIRAASDPQALFDTIRKIVGRLDPNLPVVGLQTLPEQVRRNVFVDRFISVLSTAFAILATLLAAIGLYGVLAYTVAQRTREIGLRMALGAAPARVRGMVLRQVGVMTVVGGAIGLTAAVWLASLAQSLLYQMQGRDPSVLAGAAAALGIVAVGAGLIPAHRASRVDPMTALRYE